MQAVLGEGFGVGTDDDWEQKLTANGEDDVDATREATADECALAEAIAQVAGNCLLAHTSVIIALTNQ